MIMAEVVPESMRATIYGLDSTLEGLISPLGSFLTGVLAESVFGFSQTDGCAAGHPPPPNVSSTSVQSTNASSASDDNEGTAAAATALGNALAVMMCTPWTFCFLAYSLLHFTYPMDRARSLNARGALSEGASSATSSTCAQKEYSSTVSLRHADSAATTTTASIASVNPGAVGHGSRTTEDPHCAEAAMSNL